MNKLMGFLELKSLNLPAVPWKEYTGEEFLQNDLLWTIRCAVFRGQDLNLPRLVGGVADQAKSFADKLLSQLHNNGMVIYYPYFIANKSGTLEVRSNRIIIEAVQSDLWNMVTFSDREVTLQYIDDEEIVDGNEQFLSETERKMLLSYVREVRRAFRDEMLTGKSILLEWSFAQNCNLNKHPVGDEYLVFYEARSIN